MSKVAGRGWHYHCPAVSEKCRNRNATSWSMTGCGTEIVLCRRFAEGDLTAGSVLGEAGFGVNGVQFRGNFGDKPVSGRVGFKIKLRLLEADGEKTDSAFGEWIGTDN